ncbi:hypothetical protein OG21DRAFT_1506897 [Imleria badia]|nr:hypothetical protein OG21DRAFT_1506897 [Imleria badia]
MGMEEASDHASWVSASQDQRPFDDCTVSVHPSEAKDTCLNVAPRVGRGASPKDYLKAISCEIS